MSTRESPELALARWDMLDMVRSAYPTFTPFLHDVMTELGFGLVGLGFISALSGFVGQGLQVIYGFLSNYFKRTTMLAIGNVVVGLTAMSQFFVKSYPQLIAARVAIDAGSSPQHPLGASILSRYYPQKRGWALTFHHSAGNLGSFIGPAAASLALGAVETRP